MMNQLVSKLKDNDQDFEFYPTTKEMVEVIYNDFARKDRNGVPYSLLDIGCGNGNLFNKLAEIREDARKHNIALGMGNEEDYYGGSKDSDYLQAHMRPKADIVDKFGMEKSEILIQNLPNDVVIVGTDFWNSTLLDKKVDLIFSNPPYSEFEEWTVKIINEAYCQAIYLVIPERWQNSENIKIAIRERKFKVTVLASMDFLDGERAARAKVQIIKLALKPISCGKMRYERDIEDPFNAWFNKECVPPTPDKENTYSEKEKHKEQIKAEMATGRDLIQVLEGLYNADMMKLNESYKKITSIEPELLRELGVSHENLKKGLQEKIKGLKYKYWHELFDNLDKIKKRLIASKRKMLLDKLYNNVAVDFTSANAYAIVIWVIKNSNQYFDEQLKEMYLRLTEPEYIQNYKSNQKTWEKSGWRYAKEDHSHYTLDYRIVTRDYKGYSEKSDLISDMETIANNLGFDDIGEVKSFQNHNVHFRFNKQFMKAFNIEAARLFGWLKKPDDIIKEFADTCEIDSSDVDQYFKKNFLLEPTNTRLLLT